MNIQERTMLQDALEVLRNQILNAMDKAVDDIEQSFNQATEVINKIS